METLHYFIGICAIGKPSRWHLGAVARSLIQQRLENRDRSRALSVEDDERSQVASKDENEIEHLLEAKTPLEIEHLMEKKTPEKQTNEPSRDENDDAIALQMPQLSLVPKIRTSPKKVPSKKMSLGDELVAVRREHVRVVPAHVVPAEVCAYTI